MCGCGVYYVFVHQSEWPCTFVILCHYLSTNLSNDKECNGGRNIDCIGIVPPNQPTALLLCYWTSAKHKSKWNQPWLTVIFSSRDINNKRTFDAWTLYTKKLYHTSHCGNSSTITLSSPLIAKYMLNIHYIVAFYSCFLFLPVSSTYLYFLFSLIVLHTIYTSIVIWSN